MSASPGVGDGRLDAGEPRTKFMASSLADFAHSCATPPPPGASPASHVRRRSPAGSRSGADMDVRGDDAPGGHGIGAGDAANRLMEAVGDPPYDDDDADDNDPDVEDPMESWQLYFPGQEPSEEHPAVPLVNMFLDLWLHQPIRLKGRCAMLSWDELRQCMQASDLAMWDTAMGEDPDTALASMGLALYQLFAPKTTHLPAHAKRLTARLFGVPTTPLRKIKSGSIGRFVCIRGTVIQAGNVKPLVVRMPFVCVRCEHEQVGHFPDGKVRMPTSCPAPHCRSRKFEPLHRQALTLDWQKIRVQESGEDRAASKDSGRVPRTIECALVGDLVDTCIPGDVVSVSGVVKVVSVEKPGRGGQRKADAAAVFFVYVEANCVMNSKNAAGDGQNVELVQFSRNDMMAIMEIARGAQGHPFRDIVASICPTIYGHEMVKAGLALALFGGVPKHAMDRSKLRIRGDPHVLIVGDPGLGKSQMLHAVSNLAPRGMYVTGSYSSKSGLTVTLLKEPGTGDYALEAGALVLADQGCCCIDEFDKMGDQHFALLEAMEQQCISIAKAGIVATLMARTSVIAAANPAGGHYDRSRTVSENLKLPPPLLSRFDLIFILLDRPDDERDQMLSEHVMALHGGSRPVSQRLLSQSQTPVMGADGIPQHETLLDYLRHDVASIEPIPAVLLRKYIAYARTNVRPVLSEEAKTVLEAFFLELRSKHRTMDSTPITTRQLESLIRLSEARARAELRQEVTQQDAEDVVEILKQSLFDTLEDEYGHVDFRRSSGMSAAKKATTFISALHKERSLTYNNLFTLDQLKDVAKRAGIGLGDGRFRDFVDSLNVQGYLLKRGPRTFELLG